MKAILFVLSIFAACSSTTTQRPPPSSRSEVEAFEPRFVALVSDRIIHRGASTHGIVIGENGDRASTRATWFETVQEAEKSGFKPHVRFV